MTQSPSSSHDDLDAYLSSREVRCPSCRRRISEAPGGECPHCGMELSVAILRSSKTNKTPAFVWAIRGLAFIAFAIALYLSITAVTATAPAGCGEGGGCDNVLHSEWSKLWGVPVSAPAMVVYAAIFISSFFIRPSRPRDTRRDHWQLLLVLATFAGVGAVWFIYLQLAVLGSICPYCMADHLCGLAIAAIVFVKAPVGSRRLVPGMRAGGLVATSLVVMGMFIAAQNLYREGNSDTIGGDDKPIVQYTPDPKEKSRGDGGRSTKFNDRPRDGKQRDGSKRDGDKTDKDGANTTNNGQSGDDGATFRIALPNGPNDTDGWVEVRRDSRPVRGNPDAPFVILCHVDYTCPHCRTFHRWFDDLFARYGDQIAFMVVPTPIHQSCNRLFQSVGERHEDGCDLAKISLAVWKAAPEKWAAFDDWLFDDPHGRTKELTRVKAGDLIGYVTLDEILDSGWPDELLQKNIDLYEMATSPSARSIPVVVCRGFWAMPRGTMDDFVEEFERYLPVKPK